MDDIDEELEQLRKYTDALGSFLDSKEKESFDEHHICVEHAGAIGGVIDRRHINNKPSECSFLFSPTGKAILSLN